MARRGILTFLAGLNRPTAAALVAGLGVAALLSLAFPLFLPPAMALRRLPPLLLSAVLGIAAVASGSYAGYLLFEAGVP